MILAGNQSQQSGPMSTTTTDIGICVRCVINFRLAKVRFNLFFFWGGGGGWGSEGRVIKKPKRDPWGGSTLIIKGVKGESSLLFTVICVNVFSYHTAVIFSYFKASYQSFVFNGNL